MNLVVRNFNLIFAIVFLFSGLVHAEWQAQSLRYLSGEFVFKKIISHLNAPEYKSTTLDQCTHSNNTLNLGQSSPVTGKSNSPLPNHLAGVEIERCVQSILYYNYRMYLQNTPLAYQSIIGGFYSLHIARTNNKAPILGKLYWRNLPEQEQKQFVLDILSYLLGPDDVIASFGRVSSARELASRINTSRFNGMDLVSVFTELVTQIMLLEEYLSY